MSSPKIIVKSGYIKSVTHALNILEYSGNKIAAQAVVFTDGSKMTVDQEDIIHLNKAEQEQVSGIEVTYKDGGSHVITYQQYRTFVDESRKTIRVDELTAVLDEESFTNDEGKQYHAMKDLDFFRYLSYIEARPGVEKVHGRGLFGLSGDVSIDDAKEQALSCEKSIKWSHIISLPEEDGARLGYNTRDAWANLIKAKAPQIAKAYNISLNNLVINAAYHSNTDNDHCHLLFYSRDEREGYVKGGAEALQKASERLKSLFVNEIYRDELAVIKSAKNEQELALRAELKELLGSMKRPSYAPPEAVADKLLELSDAMRPLIGKREYGYLPAGIKQQVNDILKTVVRDDKALQELYNRYMDTNRQLVSSYYADPAKIDARMVWIEADFFSPDKKHDRRMHNIIVAAAAGLVEHLPDAGRASNEGGNLDYRDADEDASKFLQSDDVGAGDSDRPGSWEQDNAVDSAASDEGKNERYHNTDKKSRKTGGKKSPMQNLNRNLYRQIQSQLKNDESCVLDEVAQQLAGAKPFDKYLHAPQEIKESISRYVADFVTLDSNQKDYIAELDWRIKKSLGNQYFKAMSPDQQLEQVRQRFVDPDAYTGKQLHEAVLKVCQQLDDYRFVAQNSSAFFFSFKKEAFAAVQDNPYDELFIKLKAEGSESFKSLSPELKGDINGVVGHLLKKNNLPDDVVEKFTSLENLPLPDFHNTLFRFVKVLDKQREVHERSVEFFKALRAGGEEENTRKAYQGVHEVLKPLVVKQYQELGEEHKEKICEVVGRVLAATGADPDTVEYYTHPDDETPIGLHSIAFYYLKRLDLQTFADEISKDFYSALQTLVFPKSDEKTILDDLFEKLKDVKGAYYQELPIALKKEIAAVVGQLLGDCKADPDVIKDFAHPDDFTPMGSHDQVFRMAKRLDQHRLVHKISGTFYSSLRNAAFIDGEMKTTLLNLNRQLAQLKDPNVPFEQLPDKVKELINDVVTQLLVTQKIPPEVRAWFVPPGEHTPLSLHNTVRRYAQYYYEHQFAQAHRQALYHALTDTAGDAGTLDYERLAQLANRLAAYPPDARYDDLGAADKAEVVRLAYDMLRHPVAPSARDTHNIMLRKLLLDKDGPKDLQNTVMYVARNLTEISARAAEYRRRAKVNASFAALRMCVTLGHTLAQMSEDNSSQQDRRNESKLERSFKHRKKEKQQNIAEY